MFFIINIIWLKLLLERQKYESIFTTNEKTYVNNIYYESFVRFEEICRD